MVPQYVSFEKNAHTLGPMAKIVSIKNDMNGLGNIVLGWLGTDKMKILIRFQKIDTIVGKKNQLAN